MSMNDEHIERQLRQYGAAIRAAADDRFASSRSRMIEAAIDAIPQPVSDSRLAVGWRLQQFKFLSGMKFSFGPQLAFGLAAAALIIVLSQGSFDTIEQSADSKIRDRPVRVEGDGSVPADTVEVYGGIVAQNTAISENAVGPVPALGEDLALNFFDGAFDPPDESPGDSSGNSTIDSAGEYSNVTEAESFWPGAEEGSLQDVQFPLVQFDPMEEYYYDEDETV